MDDDLREDEVFGFEKIELLKNTLGTCVQTLVLEPYYICKDFRNLYTHFYSKKIIERPFWCIRLHFFNKSIVLKDVANIFLKPKNYQESYLGYSIIQPVPHACVGRTIIDPYKIGHDSGRFHCLRSQTIANIQGADYPIEGYPYRSQSAEATVCAHAALWGVCRYLSDKYPVYGEVYPYDLIRMTGDTAGRRVPYRGMTYSDYSSILTQFGCYPSIIHFKSYPSQSSPRLDWRKDKDAHYDLYSYIESGFPTLISYKGHVVSAIGHTLRDILPPKAVPEKNDFYNSSELMDSIIVVDDNFPPYQELKHTGTARQYYGDGYSTLEHKPCIDSISAAVVPLPEKAFLRPKDARFLAYAFFETREIKSILSKLVHGNTKIIARTFLTSSNAFKNRLRERVTKAGDNVYLPFSLSMPHFIWVTEISPMSIYNQRECFAEVVFDASCHYNEGNPIYARIGKTVLDNTGKILNNCAVLDRWGQYTHNLGEL